MKVRWLLAAWGVLVALVYMWSCGGSNGNSSSADGGAHEGGPVDGTVGCGAASQACCDGTACGNGLTCTAGVCVVPCGAEGQACCNGIACNAGLTCGGGTCNGAVVDGGADSSPPGDSSSPVDAAGDATADAPCGNDGEACCGTSCQGNGLVCGVGICQPCATTACGQLGEACCCITGTCAQGTACYHATCTCGDPGTPCCSGFQPCNYSYTACSAGICGPCGATGQPCCPYTSPMCNAPLNCASDSGTCQ